MCWINSYKRLYVSHQNLHRLLKLIVCSNLQLCDRCQLLNFNTMMEVRECASNTPKDAVNIIKTPVRTLSYQQNFFFYTKKRSYSALNTTQHTCPQVTTLTSRPRTNLTLGILLSVYVSKEFLLLHQSLIKSLNQKISQSNVTYVKLISCAYLISLSLKREPANKN